MIPIKARRAPPIPFTAGALDRADARRRDPDLLAALERAEATRTLLLWRGRALVRGAGEALHWLPPAAIDGHRERAEATIFLGLDGEAARFAVALGGDEPPSFAEASFMECRAAAMCVPVIDTGALAQARSMLEWHRTHPRCARCGAPTELRDAGYKRVCPACAAEHFPRTDPVVIMLVHRGDRCLLGRQPRFPEGLFTCLAGFIEPGETIEDAVRREVLEEAGVRVGEVEYLTSQPWPFPSQLMIGCLAEALSESIEIDGNELAEARWIERDEVRAILDGRGDGSLQFPPSIAIARRLISAWATGEG